MTPTVSADLLERAARAYTCGFLFVIAGLFCWDWRSALIGVCFVVLGLVLNIAPLFPCIALSLRVTWHERCGEWDRAEMCRDQLRRRMSAEPGVLR